MGGYRSRCRHLAQARQRHQAKNRAPGSAECSGARDAQKSAARRRRPRGPFRRAMAHTARTSKTIGQRSVVLPISKAHACMICATPMQACWRGRTKPAHHRPPARPLTPTTTARYAHLFDDPLRKAAETAGEIFKRSAKRGNSTDRGWPSWLAKPTPASYVDYALNEARRGEPGPLDRPFAERTAGGRAP